MKTLFLSLAALAATSPARAATPRFAEAYDFIYSSIENNGGEFDSRIDGIALGSEQDECQIRLYARALDKDIEDQGFVVEVTFGKTSYPLTFSPKTLKRAALSGTTLTARLFDYDYFVAFAERRTAEESWLYVDVEIRATRDGKIESVKARGKPGGFQCGTKKVR